MTCWISPYYTSRQDSRTGAPGVRCTDVTVAKFLGSPWWQKTVARAVEARTERRQTARQDYLVSLAEWCARVPELERRTAVVRIPQPGGEVFVSAESTSPAAKGLHADLNAAANIGLRAITDPDWAGHWWWVPCDASTGRPDADSVLGSTVVPEQRVLLTVAHESPQTRRRSGGTGARPSKRVTNAWSEPGSSDLGNRTWMSRADYWLMVEDRVVRILRSRYPRDS
ncbi:MAG: type V CRISPR-associated protein Cas12b [Candidatus Riflebacteria bacterium]|nr:type V CRISPR-associated protein Cas12b [Candidatus Riflebacteria bacterium]